MCLHLICTRRGTSVLTRGSRSDGEEGQLLQGRGTRSKSSSSGGGDWEVGVEGEKQGKQG